MIQMKMQNHEAPPELIATAYRENSKPREYAESFGRFSCIFYNIKNAGEPARNGKVAGFFACRDDILVERIEKNLGC